MHLVVSGYDASPNTSPPKFFSVPWAAAGPVGKELRVPSQASLLASSNDGFLFVSFSLKNGYFCEPFVTLLLVFPAQNRA